VPVFKADLRTAPNPFSAPKKELSPYSGILSM
jgi:hypothetical protein